MIIGASLSVTSSPLVYEPPPCLPNPPSEVQARGRWDYPYVETDGTAHSGWGAYAVADVPWGVIVTSTTYRQGLRDDDTAGRDEQSQTDAKALQGARDSEAAAQAIVDQKQALLDDAVAGALAAATQRQANALAYHAAEDQLARDTYQAASLAIRVQTLTRRKAAKSLIMATRADYRDAYEQIQADTLALAQLPRPDYPGDPDVFQARKDLLAAQSDLEYAKCVVALTKANGEAIAGAAYQDFFSYLSAGLVGDLIANSYKLYDYRIALPMPRAYIAGDGSFAVTWAERTQNYIEHPAQGGAPAYQTPGSFSDEQKSATISGAAGDLYLYTGTFSLPATSTTTTLAVVGPSDPVTDVPVQVQSTSGGGGKQGFGAFSNDPGEDHPPFYLTQAATGSKDGVTFSGAAKFTVTEAVPGYGLSNTFSRTVDRYMGSPNGLPKDSNTEPPYYTDFYNDVEGSTGTLRTYKNGLQLELGDEDPSSRIDDLVSTVLGRQFPDVHDPLDPAPVPYPPWLQSNPAAWNWKAANHSWASAAKFRFRFPKSWLPGAQASYTLRTHHADGSHSDELASVYVGGSEPGQPDAAPTGWVEVVAAPGEYVELIKISVVDPAGNPRDPLIQSTNVPVQQPPGGS